MNYDDLSNSGFRKAARAADFRQRRLEAAAPDLLDLARNVAGLDPAYIEKIDGPVLVVAAIREWIEQARAAIAKAEGTS